MGKRPMRPKSSDGDREKLRAALDTGTNWRAVSPMKNLLQHSEEVRPLGAMRRGEPMQLKIVMVAGDPSAFSLNGFACPKSRVSATSTSISNFGTLGPILSRGDPGRLSWDARRSPRPTVLIADSASPDFSYWVLSLLAVGVISRGSGVG